MRARSMAMLLLLAACRPLPALAEEPYPSKPVTLVVPFAPGGALDLAARALQPTLQKVLGQPVLVVNKTGAAGAIGTQGVSTAAPDGYTVLVASTYIATLPAVDELFGRKPTFSRHDFQPVALLSAEQVLLFANAEQPWRTFQELAEDTRKRDGAVVFSSSGIYGATHVPVEMLLKATGLKMRHLPMNGGGPAVTAALGGNAQLVAAYPAVGGPHAKAGKLRPLASWGTSRHPAFPDVPTFKELGIDIAYFPWVGLLFYKAVPEPIVKAMDLAMQKAGSDPEFRLAMERTGSGTDYRNRAAFARFYALDSERLEAVVKAIGKLN